MEYFNINDVLSHNKLFNFIVGERGNGKTYGALEYVVKRHLKYGEEFIYLRRFKTEIKKVNSLFEPLKINNPKWEITEKNKCFYMNGKYMGFAHALTQSVVQASVATPKVGTIIFDEFTMKEGTYHYLNNEVEDYFLHFWCTVDRFRGVKVIFISNAYSVINPYFTYFGINFDEGNIWKNEDIIAMKTNSVKYREQIKQTRSGQLLSKTNYGNFALDNQFKLDSYDFIAEKTSNARYKFDMILDGLQVGVWFDNESGYYFITNKYSCNGTNSIKFALSNTDLKGATIFTKNVRGIFQLENLGKMYRYGRVYFEDLQIKKVYESVISKW